MIHHRQGLPLRLKASDHLASVHAWPDDLQSHAALDRFALLGHVDDAHAPFADLLQELVRADLHSGPLSRRRSDGRSRDV
jgi:hypothetical protein